jgi:hypothetical protein
MPLEGFNILAWASQTFGGLPPALLGGFGVFTLVAGAFIAVMGFRAAPISWALVVAGGGLVVLTYFIVGAAISSASTTLQGGQQVESMAPRTVPWAAAAVAAGLGAFGMRMALRAWASEERAGKAFGVLLVLASVISLFVGVQIVRGARSTSPGSTSGSDEGASDQGTPTDGTTERPRGITGGSRRR